MVGCLNFLLLFNLLKKVFCNISQQGSSQNADSLFYLLGVKTFFENQLLFSLFDGMTCHVMFSLKNTSQQSLACTIADCSLAVQMW